MSARRYDGPALDVTYQSIDDAPFWNGGETVYATDPTPSGRETVENVPVLEPVAKPDVDGQTTLDDWGWST